MWDESIESQEKEGPDQQKAESVKRIILIATLLMAFSALSKLGISLPLSTIAVGTIVFLPAYWIPPTPAISFARYAIVIESTFLAAVIAMWPIPALLRRSMPSYLADGLPMLSFFVLLYFPLLKLGRHPQETGFLKWTLEWLLIAIAVAGAVIILR